jgi:hypothetical protein
MMLAHILHQGIKRPGILGTQINVQNASAAIALTLVPPEIVPIFIEVRGLPGWKAQPD